MVVRKPALLLSSYNHVQTFYCPQTGLPCPTFPAISKPKQGSSRLKKRTYATIKSDRPRSETPNHLEWPPGPNIPTPYQILHLNPRDTYSKHCFYRLVKIYHPDRSLSQTYNRNRRNGSEGSSIEVENEKHIHALPGSVKMERYRLIVAAHEILSDPGRRQAYDRLGTGWKGQPEQQNTNWENRWSGFDTNDSPFQNATWEDWERWYNRRRAKPKPIYASNGAFVSLVILALTVGGFAQNMQVERHQDFFAEQAEMRHQRASRALNEHRKFGKSSADMPERLQDFMRARDESGFGIGDGGLRKPLRNGGIEEIEQRRDLIKDFNDREV